MAAVVERRSGLAVAAAAVAAAAYYGTAGLMSGYLALGDGFNRRLPLDSPVLGGIALGLVVGVPFSGLAVLAWRADRRATTMALACGLGLVAWIAIEVAFLRDFRFLHALFLAVGSSFAVAGRRRVRPGLRGLGIVRR